MTSRQLVVLCGGGLGDERKLVVDAGQFIADLLAPTGWEASVVELDDESSIDLVLQSQPAAAFVVDSTFGNGDLNLSLRLREKLQQIDCQLVGPSSATFLLARDKWACRVVLEQAGLPIPHGALLDSTLSSEWQSRTHRVVAKPRFGASSDGVELLDAGSDLAAFRDAHLDEFIVEEFIDGQEITIPVARLDGHSVAFDIAEVELWSGLIYSHTAKYEELNNLYVPARLEPKVAERAKRVAERCADAVGSTTFARVDAKLTASGDLRVIEVNAEPALDPDDFVARGARSSGLVYEQLLRRVFEQAIR